MAILTPEFPPECDIGGTGAFEANELRATTPILGFDQWQKWCNGALWGLARGGQLVMQGTGGVVSAGGSGTYRFYTWPRKQIWGRVWSITLELRVASIVNHHAAGLVTVDSNIIGAWTIGQGHFHRLVPFRFIETLSSQSDTPREAVIAVSNFASSGGQIRVHAINCSEIRRVELALFGPDESTYGTFQAQAPDPRSNQTGALIRTGFDRNQSAGGLQQVINDPAQLWSETRRSCLFSWYNPSGITITATSYVALFESDPPVLARPRFDGTEQATIAVAAYGHGEAGSKVQVTSTSTADSVELSLPTSDGWVVGELDVKTEVPLRHSIDGGLPEALGSGVRDRLLWQAKKVGASGCAVYGMCAGEPATLHDEALP